VNESLYTPSAWQQKFHALTTHEALGAGAAGPGKSLCLLFEPLAQIVMEHQRCTDPNHPHPLKMGQSVGWALFLRRTLKQLEQIMNIAHRIFPQIDPGATWDAQRTTWTFSSGFHYQFGHVKESASWGDYMGFEFTMILWDELNTFEEEQYNQINSRLRTADPVLGKMLKIRAMSNPTMRRDAGDSFSTKDPGWVKRHFVDPCPEGNKILAFTVRMRDGTKKKRTRIYLPATLYDNPDKEFVSQYEETLQAAKPHIRQALLFGNWDAVVGAYWGEDWVPEVHICEPFEIPYEWPVFRSMDWGYKRPGCIHWWALDDEDNLFCIRELYFQLKTDQEMARAIRAVEEDMELWKNGKSAILGPADNQLWEARGETGLSKAQVMARMGVPWVRASKGPGSRAHNAERLLARIQAHEMSAKHPGLKVFKTCRTLIRTLPIIQTDPTNAEQPMDGGEDHAVDSAMYAAAYASHGRRGIARRKRQKESWELEQDVAASSDRGYDGYGSRG
jgi:hypothetical protein